LGLLIYRGQEQDEQGWESRDKGMGSGRTGYGKWEVLTPLSLPPLDAVPCPEVKGKVCIEPSGPSGQAYLGFCSMNRLGVFLLPPAG